jgi:site-specific recombinase XerD
MTGLDLEDLPVVTEKSRARLNERQLVDYRQHRRDCFRWLLSRGKDPDTAAGYATETVRSRSYRMDYFYRWVWDREDRYTTHLTHDHADAWMESLAVQEYSNVHRSNCQKAVKMLFKWFAHEHGREPYDPEITFSTGRTTSNPRDYLTLEERAKVRDAVLEYGSVPSRASLTEDERDRWRAYLAQRFEKPASAVTSADWDRANDWKIPSLVNVGLDAGLRPIEVERAVVSWVDIDNGVLRIPKEESSKNADNWIVGLRDQTVQMLERWLAQREAYDDYDDTDHLWLTREGNPYGSSALRDVLRRLCEIAGIDTTARKMSWYAVRHSTGTYMTREEDLAAAQAQLRHKDPETTMKYDQTPVEDRKDALDRMG